MLTQSQVKTIFTLWQRPRGENVFSTLPEKNLILRIKHSPTPDQDFLEALHRVAFGELEALKTMLETAKALSIEDLMRLLLQAGDVITPGGKLIKGVTLLECALGAGDLELAEMIRPYFDEFKGGQAEFESQRERYRACLEAMETQEHDYDINWLVEIIKNSTQEDVEAELATGDNYDPAYQSPLRDAMNKFRSEMLDPKRRIIKKPSMHCNYKNFDHVDEVLTQEWNNLGEGDNYTKHRLISRQIFGFIQLIELPAYERYVHAQDDSYAAIEGRAIKRSFDYKYPDALAKTLPAFSDDLLLSHSGVGFDSWISIFGDIPCVRDEGGADARPCSFGKLVSSKSNKGREFLCCNRSNSQPVIQEVTNGPVV